MEAIGAVSAVSVARILRERCGPDSFLHSPLIHVYGLIYSKKRRALRNLHGFNEQRHTLNEMLAPKGTKWILRIPTVIITGSCLLQDSTLIFSYTRVTEKLSS